MTGELMANYSFLPSYLRSQVGQEEVLDLLISSTVALAARSPNPRMRI